MQLQGSTVLLTGATGGIGQAIAARARRARRARGAQRPARRAARARSRRDLGGAAEALPADLSDAAAAAALARARRRRRRPGRQRRAAGERPDRRLLARADRPRARRQPARPDPAHPRAAARAWSSAGVATWCSCRRWRARSRRSARALYSATKFGLRGFASGPARGPARHRRRRDGRLPGLHRRRRHVRRLRRAAAALGRHAHARRRSPRAVVRGIEQDRAEIDVAPLGLRAGALASVARAGHGRPAPAPARLGARCRSAIARGPAAQALRSACSSARSPTTTSAAPRTWSATRARAWRRSSTPRLDIDEYLRLARYTGVHIDHILETHNHADHVSGHGRLAAATGATIHIHRAPRPTTTTSRSTTAGSSTLGSVRVRALHTPGHRPEHTAFALIDAERGDEPWAVLTGDSLFVGDIARPDLAVDKDEGARAIFHSLHERLLALPDTCEVWPGHLGGSLCGGPGHGHEDLVDDRLRARALRAARRSTTRTSSRRRATAALRPQPPNFQSIVALNRGPLAVDGVDVHPLTPRQVDQAARRRRAGRRRAHRAPVRRGAHPGLGEHHGAARGLRLEARLARRAAASAWSWSAATTRTPVTPPRWPSRSGSRGWPASSPAA